LEWARTAALFSHPIPTPPRWSTIQCYFCYCDSNSVSIVIISGQSRLLHNCLKQKEWHGIGIHFQLRRSCVVLYWERQTGRH